MEPTILPGDKIWANKTAYNLRIPFTQVELLKISGPKRGDVIVFKSPTQPDMDLTKRIIGLPGDKITVVDGLISINDIALKVSVDRNKLEKILQLGGFYTESLDGKNYTAQRLGHIREFAIREWTVPEGHYFGMGDNRDTSSDSRAWGFIPYHLIKGKAKFIYFSLDWPSFSKIPKLRSERIGTFF